jgi:hypothetical protein
MKIQNTNSRCTVLHLPHTVRCGYEVSIILVNTPNMFTRFPKLDTISVSQKFTTYNEVNVNEP